jgi:hypothetical protein
MTEIEGGRWYYNNNLCNKNETNIWVCKVIEQAKRQTYIMGRKKL